MNHFNTTQNDAVSGSTSSFFFAWYDDAKFANTSNRIYQIVLYGDMADRPEIGLTMCGDHLNL